MAEYFYSKLIRVAVLKDDSDVFERDRLYLVDYFVGIRWQIVYCSNGCACFNHELALCGHIFVDSFRLKHPRQVFEFHEELLLQLFILGV